MTMPLIDAVGRTRLPHASIVVDEREFCRCRIWGYVMSKLHSRSFVLAGLILVTGLSAVYCTGTEVPAAPRNPLARSSPTFDRATLTRLLPHVKGDYAWIGELHNQAMGELFSDRTTWRNGSTKGLAERKCAAIARVTQKYTESAARAMNVRDARFVASSASKAVTSQGCQVSNPMMVLLSLTSRASATTDDDTLVITGAYETYLPSLESAINNAGSSSAAASAIDAVIAGATDLSAGDLAVLEMTATLGTASTYYWYDFEVSGGLAAMLDSLREYETSTFVLPMRIGFWRALGWGDLIGFAAGVGSAVTYSGGLVLLVPSAGLIAGTAGALGASAGVVLGFM